MGEKNLVKLAGITLLFLSLAWCSSAWSASTTDAVSQDISQLLDNMRGPDNVMAMAGTVELPRFSLKDGYLRVLGAPSQHYFPVTTVVAGNAEATAKNFLEEYRAAFGHERAAMDFTTKKVKTKNSRTYVRFQQTYSQIPVFASEITVQLNESGGIQYVLSDTMKQSATSLDKDGLSIVASISPAEATQAAIVLVSQEHPDLQFEATAATLMIYHPSVVGNVGPTQLVWQTIVSGVDAAHVKEFVLVNANNGQIAMHYSLIYDAKYREIYDAANSPADPGTLARAEGDPISGITDVDLAYVYFGDTYDFYFNHHGRDSIDNAGYTLSATVRYCPSSCPFVNAFWDGSRMYFGAGFSAADDVVSHELTHGVTQYESGLIYQNESGAINESFSDMWGEWVDQENTGGTDTPAVKWLMGEDVPVLGAIRNMANPPAFGHPDRKCSPLWYTGGGDNGGVHINSGVGNKLCYLLTDGDIFNGRIVMGMGISQTADIFYEAQTNLLTSGSDYADLYSVLTQAAINLGWSAPDRDNLEQACQAVEIIPGTCGGGPTPPQNDECIDAICVEDGIAVNGTTVGATNDGSASCGASSNSPDVWYSYTPSTSGNVTISLCGSNYDTVVSLHDACGGLQLACNDDSCGLQSRITIGLTAGTTYLIRVAGFVGSTGNFTLTVTGGQGTCGPIVPLPPVAQNGNVAVGMDTASPITLVATDDGLPNPPGELTYIIASLPSNGELSDPGNGVIDSVPYSLVSFGNQVIYTPEVSFTGSDSFQFKANDGGAPPDGGDSNIATFSVTVGDSEFILSEDFENGLGGFVIDNDSGNGLWHLATMCQSQLPDHTTPTSLYYGVDGLCNYDAGNTEGVVTSPSITLPSAAGQIELSFNYYLETEGFPQVWDQATAQVSQNGGPFVEVISNIQSTLEDPSNGWLSASVDLSAMAGSDIQIRFGFRTGDGIANSFDGFYIDDVQIWAEDCSPLAPAAPDPNDGAVEVPINTILSWNSDEEPPLPLVTITFDEVPIETSVNGMVISNVTFSFSSSDASVTLAGPGETTFIHPPSIEGDKSGTLTLDFATPVYGVSYGFVLSSSGPSQTNATSMTLFDALLQPVSIVSANAADLGYGFVEGMNSGTSTSPIVRAVIVFSHPSASRFVLDNLTYSSSPGSLLPIPMTPTDENFHSLSRDGASTDTDDGTDWGNTSGADADGTVETYNLGSTQMTPVVSSFAISSITGQIVNGDFETGDFSGWTLMDSGNGTFVINNGTYNPSGPDGPLPPYSGNFSALSNQFGSGIHTIFQDVTLPPGATSATLHWADMIRNHSGIFIDPDQEFRVEIWDTSNNVLSTLFSTNPGAPLLSGWTTRSADISSFIGMTIRIAFTEEDHMFFFNVHLDDISIELDGGSDPECPITYDVYFGQDNPPLTLVAADISATMYDPGILEYGTIYYWQIVAKNCCGDAIGSVWSFQTENTPPVADAGPDQIIECACNTLDGTKVTLDGTGSDDADGDPLTYSWTGPFVGSPVSGPTPTVTLNSGCPGDYAITLIVNDGKVDSGPDEVVVTVQDTIGPQLTLLVEPAILWPPNHRMVEITPTTTASDQCDVSPQVTLVSITSSEGDNVTGDGNTTDDIQIVDGVIYLRAERSGNGTDRVYTITYEAEDASGNTTPATATVTVPHDQGIPGEPPPELNIDIKPQSCPNPLRVNFRGKGVLPVVIVGSADFDVLTIDVDTITLEGVSPLRSNVRDVSTAGGGRTTSGRDGFPDLVLKFDRQAILAALEVTYGDLTELPNREELTLTLFAETTAGFISGTDTLVILNRGAIKRKK